MQLLTIGIKAQNENQYELISVEFIGNDAIPSEELKIVISSQESPGWISQFFNSFTGFGEGAIYFDSLLISNDIAALKSYYESRGYFEHEIDAKYFLDAPESEAKLEFHIKEGDPVVFRNFWMYGLDQLDSGYRLEINKITELDTSEVYSNAEVERNLQNVTLYLRNNGFAFSNNESPIVYIDTLKNRADVEVTFSPGEKFTVSDIRVQKTGVGSDNVDSELIKDIVGISPGKPYSYANMRRGQIRLYRTNLFTSALVTALIADTINNTIPIGISTEVGRIHEFSPEIYVNDEENEFNLGFRLGFTKKNFFGSARKATINLSIASQQIWEFLTKPSLSDTNIIGSADARLIMEQPFLFGLPVDTKLETYYTLQKRRDEWNAILYGFKFGVNFELPSYVYFNSFSGYFNLENSKYIFRESYLEDNRKKFIDAFLAAGRDTSQIRPISNTSENINAILGVGLTTNKTDDFLFPTSGYNFSLSLEDGNFLGYVFSKLTKFNFNDPLYYRIIASSAYYIPVSISDKIVLAAKIRTGLIRAYRGSKYEIPLNQKFYAGGSNSIRGWNTRELVPPLDISSLPENPTSDEIEAIFARGVIPGGFFMIEGTIEARIRLLGALGSAFFIDYGNVWDSPKDFAYKNTAVAIGFGLRYYSEIVPVRLDFGFKLYDPLDRRAMFQKSFSEVFQFHLGIGEAF
ncbi:MAG: BamA/TamA family outer membrane protein [Bacteroidetes bacterium]|nr:BamA/TamA family outer membrane protein [Bacteroidota bacterium]